MLRRRPLANAIAAGFALAASCAAPTASQAATYRCQLPSGASEYRDTPCTQGAQHVVDAAAAGAVGASPSHASNEPEHHGSGAPVPRSPDRYSFSHVRIGVRQALESLAPGPQGNLRVVVDPAVTAVGVFDYRDVTLSDLLADVARRYDLDIRNDNGLVTVRPR